MQGTYRLFAALLLAAALTACSAGGDNPAPGSDDVSAGTSGSVVTSEAPAEEVTLVSATVGADYAIVRPELKDDSILAKSKELQEKLESALGTKLALKTDWYKDTAGFPPQAHEILLGPTNRDESVAVETGWRASGYRDWTLQLVGEKLVIYAGSSEAYDEAIAYLLDNYVRDGALAVPGNLNVSSLYDWPLSNIRIGEHDIAEYQIVVPSSADQLVQESAKKVQSYIRDNTGVLLEIVKDSNQKKTTDCEILVGDTNRGIKLPKEENAGRFSYYITLRGSKLMLSGKDELSAAAAVDAFVSGSAGVTKDGVYTIDKSIVSSSNSVIESGIISTLKAYVEPRAKLGRATMLKNHMGSAGFGDLRDTDIYGNSATAVLFLPDNEVTPEAIAHANRVIRKVTGFMNTDTPTSVKNGNGVDGENDFAANRLCRVLYADPSRIEPETAEKVKRFFLNDNFQSKYFSENHMLMFRTARYLAACYYKGETFNQYKKTAEEIREIDHDYIVNFLQYRARRGWAEFDSMGYGVEDFLSLINLYDCAPDEDIRTLAAMSMDTLLLSMIVDSTANGIYGGAHGRNYETVVTNLAGGIYYIYKLYFGTSGFSEVPDSMPYCSAPFVYSSDYRPGDMLYAVVAEKTDPFSNYERTHNHAMEWTPQEYGFINKYTYNTALYSIGCVNRQDSFPRETGYEEHQQTNWSMTFANNSKASLTFHHPGNTGTHRYWCGDSGCFCNHLFGHENVVMGVYFIPGNAGSFNFFHAYVPTNEFSEVVEQPESNRIFVRLGDAYAVLRFSSPYKWNSENSTKEVLVYDGEKKLNLRVGMVCEAGDKETYGSFEAFIAAMEKKEMVFDRDTLSLTYGDMQIKLDYTKSKRQPVEHNYLDGVEQEYPYANTYDSPYAKSVFDSGVIEVYCGGYVRTMDFMNVKDTTVKKK